MNLNYCSVVILYCLEKINAERTVYSIFHLLKGKKSSQTIQDSHIFHLSKLFYLYPTLSRNMFDQAIHHLESDGYIEKISDQIYKITGKGSARLDAFPSHNPLPKHVNGWQYHTISDVFWRRLSLLVQVSSNLNRNHVQYLPIQKDKEIQLWVKKFIHTKKVSKQSIASILYKELLSILDSEEEINPSTLVIRFSGFNNYGLTPEQAAEELHIEFYEYHVQFINVLHYMLESLLSDTKNYPFIQSIIDDYSIKVPLTISTKKTFSLVQKGYTIDEIAHMRKLKSNTIEDHIVELVINVKDFDILPYVSKGRQEKILHAVQNASSKQLKQIRQLVQEASYFEIRLVMAKYGEKEWN
ncbi:helix-turn-helix domain-containing protein [Bacillus massilinigeriensis]|uniref:helix-turn-helix domain-containing protein n=1 Tax=Bacillus massilionigeriensis TaxID=1805475 RepID=UPI00096B6170|nr:helix-turn-helix domain-containing protein [Bacillus massilionigeriensis]